MNGKVVYTCLTRPRAEGLSRRKSPYDLVFSPEDDTGIKRVPAFSSAEGAIANFFKRRDWDTLDYETLEILLRNGSENDMLYLDFLRVSNPGSLKAAYTYVTRIIPEDQRLRDNPFRPLLSSKVNGEADSLRMFDSEDNAIAHFNKRLERLELGYEVLRIMIPNNPHIDRVCLDLLGFTASI